MAEKGLVDDDMGWAIGVRLGAGVWSGGAEGQRNGNHTGSDQPISVGDGDASDHVAEVRPERAS